MKYAIFSDIHSNWHALQAAHKDALGREADRFLNLGDTVGYNANPKECVEWAQEHAEVSLKGNHDEAVTWEDIDYQVMQRWSKDAQDGVAHSQKELSSKEVDWLKSLPFEKTISLDNNIKFSIRHGAPRTIPSWSSGDETPQNIFERHAYVMNKWEAVMSMLCFKETGLHVGFFGHSHIPTYIESTTEKDTLESILFWMGLVLEGDILPLKAGFDGSSHILINPGSIGQPRGCNKPGYVILDTDELKMSYINFSYDREAARDEVLKKGYSDRIAEQIMREV